jgi:hypothetical protein
MAFIPGSETHPISEAQSVSNNRLFEVVQLADAEGNIINPASGQLVFDGEVSIGTSVEISNDEGNPIPTAPNIEQGGGATTPTTTRVTLASDGPGVADLASIAGLSIPAHDYIALSYTGTNLTGVQYRTGGASGTIVGTLTLAYSGSNLVSVTRS